MKTDTVIASFALSLILSFVDSIDSVRMSSLTRTVYTVQC